jgi:hypothetical protein
LRTGWRSAISGSCLLSSDNPPVHGVALVEHLFTDDRSPLYGNQAELLRDELHRHWPPTHPMSCASPALG